MRIVVGTSGFSYPEWRGTFYPEGLPEKAMLSAYGERLPSVEINNTFYQMPKPALFEGWLQKVPENFTFAIKAPRRITHISKLENVDAAMALFLQTARILGARLGPLLFQLPPTFKKNEAVLEKFLKLCPKDLSIALEFRHASWFEDSVYTLLREHAVALVAAEVDADEGEGSPYVHTAPFSYIRLRKNEYDEAGLAAALERIRALGVERAFVYMKHEVLGPSYAQKILERAGESWTPALGALEAAPEAAAPPRKKAPSRAKAGAPDSAPKKRAR